MRHAQSIQRYAELACSSEAADRDQVRCPGGAESCLCRDYGSFEDGRHGTVPRYAVRDAQKSTRIERLLAPFKVTPVFQGDPRGACVKLRVPSGRTNDWGQTGICVPTRY
jgi:hypothetical protein